MQSFPATARAHSEPIDGEDAVFSAMLEYAAALLDAPAQDALACAFRARVDGLLALFTEEAEPCRFLESLPDFFGNGLLLHTVFSRLFPSVSHPLIAAVPDTPPPVLTRRERQVLCELAKGGSGHDIAEHLFISEKTVKKHLENLRHKLHAESRQEMVQKAQGYGLVTFDLVDFLGPTGDRRSLDARPFSYQLLEVLQAAWEAHSSPRLRQMTMLGLFLFAVPILAAGLISQRSDGLREKGRGQIWEYSPDGTLLGRFAGETTLCRPSDLAFAPPAAARWGFTPGHLYVLDRHPTDILNASTVFGFSPEGEPLTAFTGGSHYSAYLNKGISLAFAAEGRLLVHCGAHTNAILEFTEGGGKVRRFAKLTPYGNSLATDAQGQVYAIGGTPASSPVQVYDAQGRHRRQIGQTEGGAYSGLAVDLQGHVYVGNHLQHCIEVFEQTGRRLGSFGQGHLLEPSYLALSPSNRLYVTADNTPRISVFDPLHCALLFAFDLPGGLHPCSLTFGPNGNLYVGGYTTEK